MKVNDFRVEAVSVVSAAERRPGPASEVAARVAMIGLSVGVEGIGGRH